MSTLATDVQSGDGSTTVFTLAFEFLSRDDVTVSRLASTDPDTAEGTALTVIETGTPTGDQYAWTSDAQIQLGTAPTSDQKVKFQRVTPIDSQVVEWNDGSFLIAEDLNDSDLQSLYLIQELTDRVATDEDAGIGEAPDDGELYGRQSKAWSVVPEGISDAPDEKLYGRKNGEWSEIPADQQGVPEAPSDGSIYGRKDESWTEITGSGGGVVEEIVAGTAITVDAADEERPVVSVTEETFLPWDISSLDSLPGGGGGGGDPSVSLTSSSFTAGAAIGTDYFYDQGVCGGNNTSPQLSWSASDLASGRSVSSWTLLIIDNDADDFVHWSVAGIPADQTSIAEDGAWSAGATVNETGYSPDPVRENGWGGPCPPEEHTYSITLTAVLDDDSTIDSTVLQFTAAPGGGGGGGGGDATVAVTSTSFTAGAAIGQAYYYDQQGCPGQNTSPELSWSISDLPEGRSVASWAVVCIDPDGQNFIHWRVNDIPSSQTSISENGSWEAGADVQQNDFFGGRDNGWAGPCPPEQHTYQITVTATLDDDSTVESEALTFIASS